MKTLIVLLSGVLLLAACIDLASLRGDRPLLQVREYEMLLAGNLEADFVGDENCLAKCHKHDQIGKDFRLSVHGEQLSAETGLPLVNCESCHGAGSLAIKHAEQSGKCDPGTFLQLGDLPSQVQSLVCLKCHSAASTPNLHNWNASAHAVSDVSCFDCHKLHQGPQQKAGREEMSQLCYECHQDVQMAFNQFSHHPVREGKMVCVDCHNPHGSTQEKLLKGTTVKETCTRCHMEVQGPYVYEHADVTEDCRTCHTPHGSPNTPLLTTNQPFLCMQCHAGHQNSVTPTLTSDAFKGAFYTRCTDCHSQIHGTDIPSSKGRGTFLAR